MKVIVLKKCRKSGGTWTELNDFSDKVSLLKNGAPEQAELDFSP
jgi:hypothetical protein